MESVGVESGSKKLIVNNFKGLRRVFSPCFSFLRDLRDHYCPLLCHHETALAWWLHPVRIVEPICKVLRSFVEPEPDRL